MSREDLIPFSERTEDEQKEIARKGGIASGAARRRKRSLKEAADLYLSLPVKDNRVKNKIARSGVDEEDIDYQMAVIVGLTGKAVKGDSKAAKVLFDLLDKAGAEQASSPDDGFLDALREEAADVWRED